MVCGDPGHPPEEEPRPPGGEGVLVGSSHRRLLVAIGLVVAAVALMLSLWSLVPIAQAPTETPSSEGPSAAAPGGGPIAAPAGKPVATPQPKPTVVPSAVPPRVTPTMLPVVNVGMPPVRRPRTDDPDPSTVHFIVEDGDSGTVLFQSNAYKPIAPASLTKIMTAVLAIEYGGLSETVKVDTDAGGFPGSDVMGLRMNSEVSFKDLLYGMMLLSANDAAVAIGHHVAGSGAAFVARMNDKAASLGLGGTHFANSFGFDAEDHYSCPADMVTLARYAMQYPLFRQIVATEAYELHDPNGPRTIRNVNGLLNNYPGADGVKTGDTPNAGRCLVGTAVRNGHRVYVAFMRSPNGAVADGTLLLYGAFNSHSWPSATASPSAR